MEIFDNLRFYDFRVYYRLYELGTQHGWLGDFFLFFAKYGIVFFFLSFAYLIWMKRIRAFICSFVAMAIAGSLDVIVWIFWQRPRPFVTYATLVDPILSGMRVDSTSFPSSHTYIVFAIAISVFLYGHRRLGIALIILAILTALGRIGAGLHYPSDVLAGAFVGIFSGMLAFGIINRVQKNWHVPKEDRIEEII